MKTSKKSRPDQNRTNRKKRRKKPIINYEFKFKGKELFFCDCNFCCIISTIYKACCFWYL